MKRAPVIIFVAFLAGVCLLLAGAASTLALQRSPSGRLDGGLDSMISADYSADPRGGLGAVDGRIIDAARRDDAKLADSGGELEIVGTFFVEGSPPAGGYVGNVGGGDSGSGGPEASPTSAPKPGGGGETPAPGDTPTPVPGVTPTPTPVPGVTPTPGATPSPTPMPTPTPTPTPGPTPIPSGWTLYLHNNPTPPTGNTVSQPILPMDEEAPSTFALPNYDIDRDFAVGLTIKKGGTSPNEPDPRRRQHWQTDPFPAPTLFQGDMVLELWAGMKDFGQGKRGHVTAFLRDFNGAAYSNIKVSNVLRTDWQQGSSSWVYTEFALGQVSFVLPAGHSLELTVLVNNDSDDDMWFAYDNIVSDSRFFVQ